MCTAFRSNSSLEIETVDSVEAASVHALRERRRGHRIDVLFVNAGICKAHEETPSAVDERDFVDMMLTNALGRMRAVELFENLVPTNGAIAVMTPELGSMAGNRGFWELYSSSKAALNMLMKCFSARHAGDPRALLLVAPGWVRTDMGPLPQRSRSKKASRSSRKSLSAVAAGPVCASSNATVESCPGDSKASVSATKIARRSPLCQRTSVADRAKDIHWPEGFNPSRADLFSHNALLINASCERICGHIVDATKWPQWYPNSKDVRTGGGGVLKEGTVFHWSTFGLWLESNVNEFLPYTHRLVRLCAGNGAKLLPYLVCQAAGRHLPCRHR
jgi:NAD(P)-dependent dehydrogenase (short-subunit alcohol dehydrogenase family)